jgi:5-methylcytosine-specific restriction protein A
MPDGAHHECRVPYCASYAVAGGFCPQHRGADMRSVRGPAGQISYTSARYRWMRKALLAREPMCRACKTEPATELDHIVPHRGDPRRFWDQANWQGLCVKCHGKKTARETLQWNQ